MNFGRQLMWNCQYQGYGYVCGVFSQNFGGIGDIDVVVVCGDYVDIVDVVVEIGDQFQVFVGL